MKSFQNTNHQVLQIDKKKLNNPTEQWAKDLKMFTVKRAI